MPVVPCPNCHKPIDVALELQGQTVVCPLCNRQFTVGERRSADLELPPPFRPDAIRHVVRGRAWTVAGKKRPRPWYLSWRVVPIGVAVAVLVTYLVVLAENNSELAVVPKLTQPNRAKVAATVNRAKAKPDREAIDDREQPKPTEKEMLEAPTAIDVVARSVTTDPDLAIVRQNPPTRLDRQEDRASALVPAVSTDPDLALVRNLLKENLPTGKWEEIRWWPKRYYDPKPPRQSVIGWGGKHICRLKFRTGNEAGGMEVIDQVFGIDNGKIEGLPSYSDRGMLPRLWHEDFPDDPY